jgi:hypothetical protein
MNPGAIFLSLSLKDKEFSAQGKQRQIVLCTFTLEKKRAIDAAYLLGTCPRCSTNAVITHPRVSKLLLISQASLA